MYEVLLATESTGQHFNISAYNAANGQTLSSLKGGTSQPRTLCLNGDEHIISAMPNKPILQVYEVSRKNQQPRKIPLPGIAKTLCISHDGALLVAGISNNVLVWELAGGELLGVLSRHYQNVTCLAFSHDDSYLIASGEDGIVSVWDLGLVWDSEEQNEPYHSWTCHTMAVTNLKFGLRYRAYSSSLDCSVKIHDVPTCQTLITVVFDFGVTTFDLDPCETSLFAGCTNGSLHRIDLLACGHARTSSLLEATGDSNTDKRSVVKSAHLKMISCITSSLDGTWIISGSEDCEIKFWDAASLQCLKNMKLPGTVTNLKCVPAFPGFSVNASKSILPFPKLHRQVKDAENDAETETNVKHFRITKFDDLTHFNW